MGYWFGEFPVPLGGRRNSADRIGCLDVCDSNWLLVRMAFGGRYRASEQGSLDAGNSLLNLTNPISKLPNLCPKAGNVRLQPSKEPNNE